MYSPFRLAQKYFRYYLTAANGNGHGTHSPFVFDFITKVLNDKEQYPAYDPIESLRTRLLTDKTTLQIRDLGAGPANPSATNTRTIASIAKNAAKPRKLGQLLYRVAAHYKPATILELGTSLGLSTAYLASGASTKVVAAAKAIKATASTETTASTEATASTETAKAANPASAANPAPAAIHTIEGSPEISAAAKNNLQSLSLPVTIHTGPFDDILPSLLPVIPPIDLAFIDGNHRLDPTLYYFYTFLPHLAPASALIFDDIHWSAEMETAWASIKADPRVYLTIDLFFLGFVFFRPEFKVKQDFIIRF
jgi:predicted O-methyltransferase YrrM